MAAKAPKRSSGGNKGDFKTTLIVVLLVIVAVQALVLFNSSRKPADEKSPVKKPAVVVRTVKPAPVAVLLPPPAVKPVLPLKKVPAGSAGKIAIILDDWGYTPRNCKYLKEIKEPLGVAILPNLRHTDTIAKCAAAAGEDIMLHLPLEPYHNNDRYPDNYLITTKMKPSKVLKLLQTSLNKMPTAQGVNNHMGSKATEDKELMKIIFQELKKRNLFFVDSMTSPHRSVCGDLADEMGLTFGKRDVFLDNVNTKAAIEEQIAVLADKARKKGYAVAIGHDRELTLQVIQQQIPLLKEQGFEIVSIKELLKK